MTRLRSFLPAFFVAACGLRRDQVVASLDQRDLAAAQQMHDEALGTPRSELPSSEGRDTGLLLLDRAMIRAARGDFGGASTDFAAADKIVDGDDILRTKRLRIVNTSAASLYMFQRGWGQALNMPVGLKFYERLLVNPFAALSRLQTSDLGGACVEARRYGVIDEATDAIARGRATDVRRFGELVSAIACDAGGDDAMACAAWNRAAVAQNDSMIARRCAHEPVESTTSDVWVFVAYGRATQLVAREENGKRVVVLANGRETEGARDLAVTIDGRGIATREAVDVDAAARTDFTESQSAIEYEILGAKGRTGRWSDVAWTVLPAHVGIAHSNVREGAHEIRIRVRGEETARTVDVARGRPAVAFVYVPW